MIRGVLNQYLNRSGKRDFSILTSPQRFHLVRQVKVSCTTCQPDVTLGGASDPTCPACNGTGYNIIEQYSTLMGRVVWGSRVDQFVSVGRLLSGSIGDCEITTDPQYEKDIIAVRDSGGWVKVDRHKLKVISTFVNRVEQDSSLVIVCDMWKST